MFTNILFFMLALFVFHTGPTDYPAAHPSWVYFWGVLVAYLFFGNEVRHRFKQLKLPEGEAAAGSFVLQHRFQQIQQRLMIESLLFFGVEVYFLNLRALLRFLPGTQPFGSFEGILGLSIYLLHLLPIWHFAFPAHKLLFHSTLTRRGYVRSQFQFNLPILFPWLLVTTFSDILEYTVGPRLRGYLDHPLGELSYLLGFLLVLSIFLPYLIKIWWQCRPIPDGPKKEEIQEFCRAAGSPFREILLWPVFEGQMLTAGVMGLVKRFRYLLITPALLQLLDPEELKGVVAHEIGHIRKKHLFFYLLFFAGYVLIALLFYQLASRYVLTRPEVLQLLARWQSYSEGLISLFTMLPLAVLLVLYFRFLFGFFMRNFERQADLQALQMIGTPEPLIGSLEKISLYSGQDRNLPSWHHYSIAERVAFLEQGSREPGRIARHHRKVFRSVAVFVLLLVGLGFYGWRSPGIFMAERQSEARILEKLLEKELRARPDDPRILAGLGLIYQEQKKYGPAEEAYKKVLKQDPRNPLVLNNLAWMYATSPDPQFFKPKEALALSQAAAALKPDPVVWDTLAEAYLVNGRPDLSLRIMEEILAGDPDKREYFEGQRERFRKEWEKKKQEEEKTKMTV
ncbi:MAG: M48 family metalloprotease [Deltaproteobacteria bacterium]|nr:M48 family metalloprotease [Deltaproteobacteria bacterium]